VTYNHYCISGTNRTRTFIGSPTDYDGLPVMLPSINISHVIDEVPGHQSQLCPATYSHLLKLTDEAVKAVNSVRNMGPVNGILICVRLIILSLRYVEISVIASYLVSNTCFT
jgi:hypothetical protein